MGPLHYGIIYHVYHPCMLFSCINIVMQIVYIKGTTQTYFVIKLYQIK